VVQSRRGTASRRRPHPPLRLSLVSRLSSLAGWGVSHIFVITIRGSAQRGGSSLGWVARDRQYKGDLHMSADRTPPAKAVDLYSQGLDVCMRHGLPLSGLRVDFVDKAARQFWGFDGARWREALILNDYGFCRWVDAGPGRAHRWSMNGSEFFCGSRSRVFLELTPDEATAYSLPQCRTPLHPRSKNLPLALLMQRCIERNAK